MKINFSDKESQLIVMCIFAARRVITPSPLAQESMLSAQQIDETRSILRNNSHLMRIRNPSTKTIRALWKYYLENRTSNRPKSFWSKRVPREEVQYLLSQGWSVRRIARSLPPKDDGSLWCSFSTVCRIAAELKYRSYKETVAHHLTQEKADERLAFARLTMHKFAQNEFSQLDIFFTDEAYFQIGAYYHSKNNCRYYLRGEQEVTLHPRSQAVTKVMVFAGVHHKGGLFGPYIIRRMNEPCQNSEAYTIFLRDILIPEMRRRLGDDFNSVYYQQDGASCHTSALSINYLRGIFGRRLISLTSASLAVGSYVWPPTSPDLTPLDYSV